MPINFSNLLQARSAELTAFIAATRSVLWHPGQKGGAAENRVRDFLRSVLPERLGVTEGFIYGADQSISPQCDVIIYDKLSAPVMFHENGTRAIPAECVFGTVEVKTQINTTALKKIVTDVQAVQNIPKTCFRSGQPIVKTFQLSQPPLSHYPTLNYVIAFESAVGLDSIAKVFETELAAATDYKKVIHCLTVIGGENQGTITYRKTPSLEWASFPSSTSVVSICSDPDHFLLFMGIFLDLMLAAELYAPFNFLPYLGDKTFNGT